MYVSRRSFMLGAASLAFSRSAQSYDIRQFSPHWEARLPVIRGDIMSTQPGSIFLLGDSISEFCPYKDVAGRALVNCGFSGIRQRQLADYAQRFLPGSKPAAILLFGGKNTARADVPWDEMDGVVDDTRRLAQLASATGARLLFCTVTPTEKIGGMQDLYTDVLAAKANSAIKSVAANFSAKVLDINQMLSDDGSWARAGTTKDGVHLKDETYAILKQPFDRAVAGLLQ